MNHTNIFASNHFGTMDYNEKEFEHDLLVHDIKIKDRAKEYEITKLRKPKQQLVLSN